MTRYRFVMTLLLTIGAAYLAAHMWVSGVVWTEEGWMIGIITFLAVGFADAYWTYAWWNRPDMAGPWTAAAACAVASFVSWGARPFTRPYLIRMGIEEGERRADTERSAKAHDSHHHDVPVATGSGAGDRNDRPGGAA